MKKSISLLIFIALLAVFCSSCAKTREYADKNGEDSQMTPHESKVPDIGEYVKSLSKERSFKGEKYTIAGCDSGFNFPSEDETKQSSVSRAVYLRDIELEDKLGVKTEYIKTADDAETYEMVKNSVQSGEASYDLAVGSIAETGLPLILSGSLSDVSEYSSIDLSKEWWAPSLVDSFAVKDCLYILAGCIVPEYYSNASCVLFNKNVARQFNISGLYESVRNNNWTVDKLFEAAAVIPDNSGLYRYGVARQDAGLSFLMGGGFEVTHFDGEHTPSVYTSLSDALTEFSSKISEVLSDSSISMVGKFDSSMEADEVRQNFIASRTFFVFDQTGAVPEMRGQDSDFGILPYPKADSTQEDYVSYADSWSGKAAYLPKNEIDKGKTSVVTEALGALSKKHLDSVCTDMMLAGKQTYDAESKDMLEIIFSSIKYDMCPLYSDGTAEDLGPMARILSTSFFSAKADRLSGYSAYSKIALINLDRLIKACA